jgi:hypothetical protein
MQEKNARCWMVRERQKVVDFIRGGKEKAALK